MLNLIGIIAVPEDPRILVVEVSDHQTIAEYIGLLDEGDRQYTHQHFDIVGGYSQVMHEFSCRSSKCLAV